MGNLKILINQKSKWNKQTYSTAIQQTLQQPINPKTHIIWCFNQLQQSINRINQHSTSYNIYPTDQTTITTQTNFTTFSRKHKLVATPHKIISEWEGSNLLSNFFLILLPKKGWRLWNRWRGYLPGTLRHDRVGAWNHHRNIEKMEKAKAKSSCSDPPCAYEHLWIYSTLVWPNITKKNFSLIGQVKI